MPPTTRFAPSPTGYLHLGHAFAALTAWSRARAAGGHFLLRIEDIDPQRCRADYAAAIIEDLAWLGLDWDGAVRVQSQHRAEYRAVLDGLARRGLLYPCFCTRAAIAREIAASGVAPHGAEAVYPGTCRHLADSVRVARLAAGEPHALRLDMAAARAAIPGTLTFEEEGEGAIACDPARFGDIVLGRRDAAGSYHLCVTHDDFVQGVTLVTRGNDLRPATALHRLIQALHGWPTPHYAHHQLLAAGDGRRLAKRDGATTLRAMRAIGVAAEAIRHQLGG